MYTHAMAEGSVLVSRTLPGLEVRRRFSRYIGWGTQHGSPEVDDSVSGGFDLDDRPWISGTRHCNRSLYRRSTRFRRGASRQRRLDSIDVGRPAWPFRRGSVAHRGGFRRGATIQVGGMKISLHKCRIVALPQCHDTRCGESTDSVPGGKVFTAAHRDTEAI